MQVMREQGTLRKQFQFRSYVCVWECVSSTINFFEIVANLVIRFKIIKYIAKFVKFYQW